MKQLKDKVVLITGGASGIGKIMTRLMLERAAKVIIWDINKERIAETIDDLSDLGNITGYTIDLSDYSQIKEVSDRVKQEFDRIDVLINNAGIVIGKFFNEHTKDDILNTMNINANAPMFVTQAFINGMIDRDSGHICNIASSGGIISNPKMSVYAASKWSVIGWSDSLRIEMKQMKKNVNVTTVMPYYINTGMFDGVESKIPILEPEATALTIVRAIERNAKMLTIPGYIYRFTRLGQAIMSINFFDWFAGTVLGIYKTMDHFTGRK